MIASNLALSAATHPPIHAPTDAGAVGIIVIYAVGALFVVGMCAWMAIGTAKDRRKDRAQLEYPRRAFKMPTATLGERLNDPTVSDDEVTEFGYRYGDIREQMRRK